MNEFSCSGDVFNWISGFINNEKGRNEPAFRRSFRLDRMIALAAIAGNPEKCAPVIHIAGSKGKGSVTAMISSILEAEGFRPARYSSPHVSDWRERLSAGSVFFDENVYIEAGKELAAVVDVLDRTISEQSNPEHLHLRELFDSSSKTGERPTFFELMTLYFFLCAKRDASDVMVVETGMGGRLDATNIVDPLVSVITSIELEHTEYLGGTIAAIAGEKAGIIKPGKPLVLSEQAEESLSVFKEISSERNSPLRYFPDIAAVDNVGINRDGTAFTLTGKIPGFCTAPLRCSIPICGEIQAKNAALAVLAAVTAFPKIKPENAAKGLEHCTLPARFERLIPADGTPKTTPSSVPIIIDGAHTPTSITFCIDTFTALYGDGAVLLFGCAAKKNDAEMARALIPHFSRIIITTPGSFKLSFPEDVYRIFLAETEALKSTLPAQAAGAKPALPSITLIAETAEAIETAFAQSREYGLPLLCTGSFYLAAEVREAFFTRLRNEKPS
ncbi:bifunctional folylpolyglutamate synthase/dihydrofolate synthase [Spirochaetia bacterium]|nr:bifunctional folylpolyglutamate synthase/dihydrofolate synthase [Spirochaetia bacterium]